jgi:hypothetical protein
MKKSAKQVSPSRKLTVKRDVIAQLKPPELTQVMGGNGEIQTAPLCSFK